MKDEVPLFTSIWTDKDARLKNLLSALTEVAKHNCLSVLVKALLGWRAEQLILTSNIPVEQSAMTGTLKLRAYNIPLFFSEYFKEKIGGYHRRTQELLSSLHVCFKLTFNSLQ